MQPGRHFWSNPIRTGLLWNKRHRLLCFFIVTFISCYTPIVPSFDLFLHRNRDVFCRHFFFFFQFVLFSLPLFALLDRLNISVYRRTWLGVGLCLAMPRIERLVVHFRERGAIGIRIWRRVDGSLPANKTPTRPDLIFGRCGWWNGGGEARGRKEGKVLGKIWSSYGKMRCITEETKHTTHTLTSVNVHQAQFFLHSANRIDWSYCSFFLFPSFFFLSFFSFLTLYADCISVSQCIIEQNHYHQHCSKTCSVLFFNVFYLFNKRW